MCIDFFGNVREEGCIYFNDPLECQLVECVDLVEHLVLDLADDCPAPLNDQCFLEDSSGCCPTYNCCTYRLQPSPLFSLMLPAAASVVCALGEKVHYPRKTDSYYDDEYLLSCSKL